MAEGDRLEIRCTICAESKEGEFIFGEVLAGDEQEAVRIVNEHIESCGYRHKAHIIMRNMERDGELIRGGPAEWKRVWEYEMDEAMR